MARVAKGEEGSGRKKGEEIFLSREENRKKNRRGKSGREGHRDEKTGNLKGSRITGGEKRGGEKESGSFG